MHVNVYKFENNSFIHFKNCICDYMTPKIATLSPYETQISNIIITCIKNCHHPVNHHCWIVQIWFCISNLFPLCDLKLDNIDVWGGFSELNDFLARKIMVRKRLLPNDSIFRYTSRVNQFNESKSSIGNDSI